MKLARMLGSAQLWAKSNGNHKLGPRLWGSGLGNAQDELTKGLGSIGLGTKGFRG